MRFISFILIAVFSLVGVVNTANAQTKEFRKEDYLRSKANANKQEDFVKGATKNKIKNQTVNGNGSLKNYRTRANTMGDVSPDTRKKTIEEKSWDLLTAEEKAAKRAYMRDRWSKYSPEMIAERRERFKNMPEERKTIMKERYPDIYNDLMLPAE